MFRIWGGSSRISRKALGDTTIIHLLEDYGGWGSSKLFENWVLRILRTYREADVHI